MKRDTILTGKKNHLKHFALQLPPHMNSLTVQYTFFVLATYFSITQGVWSSERTGHSQTGSMPGTSKAEEREEGWELSIGWWLIGPAGIVDLRVTTTGYGESQQWGGRVGASRALFDQLNACESRTTLQTVVLLWVLTKNTWRV